MKRITSFLLLLAMTVGAWAVTGLVGGINYSFNDGYKATVVALGSGKYTGSVVIPKSVSWGGMPYAVTAIGEGAFSGCPGLTSVTVPEGVTSIAGNAFYNCGALTTVVLPTGLTSIGNYVFYGCTALTTLSLPASVTEIGSSAFNGCSKLAAVTLPEGLTTVWYDAFRGCTSLADLTLPSTLTTIESNAFYGCTSLTGVVFPASVTTINSNAFNGCTKLASACFSGQPTMLGSGAFYGCSSLSRIILLEASNPSISDDAFENLPANGSLFIPSDAGDLNWIYYLPYGWTAQECSAMEYTTSDNQVLAAEGFYVPILSNSYEGGRGLIVFEGKITRIYPRTFENCSQLTSINIPDGVGTIEEQAFYKCSNLTAVTLPASLKSLGVSAFGYCSSLAAVTIPGAVKSIKKDTFHDCTSLTTVTLSEGVQLIEEGAFSSCTSLTSVTLPTSLKSIGKDAFQNCSSLTTISLPAGMTVIGESAFNNCTALTSVTLPNSITSIGKSAFYGCTGLAMVSIPASVTSIGSSAFNGCGSLASLYLQDGLTTIGDDAFAYCSHLTAVMLPASVTTIGARAFYECGDLQYLFVDAATLPAVGDNAFNGLKSGGWVLAPRNSDAFEWLSVLPQTWISRNYNTLTYTSQSGTTVTPYNASVFGVPVIFNRYENGKGTLIFAGLATAIGNKAFRSCSAITSLVIPETVTSIGEEAFYSCTGLENITLPAHIKSIGTSAFRSCSNLSDITLSASLTTIGANAFRECVKLVSVTVPDKVTSIGGYAFGECPVLQFITLPASLASVGAALFNGCSSLASVVSNATTPPTAAGALMADYTKTSLYVPLSAVSDYQAATGWSSFAPHIIGAHPVQYKTAVDGVWTSVTDDGSDILAIDDTWAAFNVQNECDMATVTYSRKFGTDKWQSLYLPFEAKVADLEGKFDVAYVNNFVQYADSKGNVERSSIEIVPVTEGSLRANTPYFIRAKVADSNNPQVMTFHNVTLKPTSEGCMSHVESAVSMADFYGTFTPIDKSVVVADHLFLVSGGDFKWLNQNVKCFRTYMKLTSKDPMFIIDPNAAIQIRVIGEDYDDDATGINGNYGFTESRNDENHVVYDLQGRRVDNPQRGGLYIVGGKKVLIQ